MSAYIKLIKKNAGVLLPITNLVLILLVVLTYNPFNLFKTGYAGASLILDINQSHVKRIEIQDPDHRNLSLILDRKEPLSIKPGKEDRGVGPQYAWNLRLSAKDDSRPTQSFKTDQERVNKLFSALKSARTYYSLNRSPAKDHELEMGKNKEGQPLCLKLVFYMVDGSKKNSLCLGKARGDESYVRLNEDNEYYLIQSNIKSAAGAGEPTFFRNRAILPRQITVDNTASLSAVFIGKGAGGYRVILSKSGKEWQLQAPIAGKGDENAIRAFLEDILGWKAIGFPETAPENLEDSMAMNLEIIYNTTLTQPQRLTYQVLGKKEFNTYYVKDASGQIYKVNSAFLGDLREADKRFLAKPPGGGGLPPIGQ